MSNFNLASMPRSILHIILSKVATNNLRDFGSARIAFSEFNRVGRDEYFYRSADLFHLNDWIDEARAVRTFRLKCYRAHNPQAIYLRGMYEYFVCHLLEEGRQKIQLAANLDLLLAKYVDGMLNLAFSVDDRGVVWDYPSFSREFVDQMFYLITCSGFGCYWGYEKPESFMSLLEKINPNGSQYCWWSTIEPPEFVVSLVGSRTRWMCDRCFWQCAAWDFCNEIHLTAASWPIED